MGLLLYISIILINKNRERYIAREKKKKKKKRKEKHQPLYKSINISRAGSNVFYFLNFYSQNVTINKSSSILIKKKKPL
jgi:hypothetical protein